MGKYQSIGYVFEDEIQRGLELYAPWYLKIPDTKMVGFVNSILRKHGYNTIIFPKVPADYILHKDNGEAVYIEAKATRKKSSFPFDNLKEHQLIEGYTIDTIGPYVNYYFVIYFKYYQEIYAIKPDVLLNHFNEGHMSIKYELVKEHGISLSRFTAKHHPYKSGAFIDIRKLLED